MPEPIMQAAAGHHFTLLLAESGNLWACGNNTRGQLGLGSKVGPEVREPRRVKALEGGSDCHSLHCTVQGSSARGHTQTQLLSGFCSLGSSCPSCLGPGGCTPGCVG